MSKDESTTQDLVQVAEDGKDGYAKGAEELAGSDQPQLADTFRKFSAQREKFVVELRALAATYGDQADKDGSVAAAVHRGWLALRNAVTGSGPDSVLKTAEQGEDHAISVYEKALEGDISDGLRGVAERQLAEIRSARAELASLLERSH